MTGRPLLEVRDLTVTYGSGAGAVRAVRGVDFALQPGQTLGMAGESGCGKTTVALSLLRLLPATATIGGQILFKGEDVLGLGWQKLRAVRWAEGSVVFQGAMSALNPVRTVGEQICEPILLHEKVTRREAEARTASLLGSVGVPARRAGSYPHELSGGQRQRVMIAMALACQPDLIIADEPTTALDVIVQAQVLALLTDLVAERQIGMIVISHDLAVLGDVCEQLAVMYAGRIAELGPSKQVLGDPRHPYTRILSRAFPRTGDPSSRLAPQGLPGEPPDLSGELSGCAFEPRCPVSLPECATREVELWPAGDARTAACVYVLPEHAGRGAPWTEEPVPGLTSDDGARREGAAQSALPSGGSGGSSPRANTAGAILEASDLRVEFPARRGRGPARAVDEVNLAVGRGEIVALIGESGCGKSTLARALVGLVPPTGGEVRYEGQPLRYAISALREHRRHVQLILQDPAGALNPRQNVYDAVAEGPRLHGQRAGLNARVTQALEQAGLRPAAQYVARYPHELSGGQQQRVVIAGALALDPAVLVADEPVSSLDASVRGEILRLILDLRDQLGLSALIVSHDLGVAWNIADRVAVMYLGRIVEQGPVADVLLRPRHPYTQALIAVLPGGEEPAAGEAPDADTRRVAMLAGEPPDPTRIPSGCRFHPRCPRYAGLAADDPRAGRCRTEPVPVLAAGLATSGLTAGGGASLVACHLADLEETSEAAGTGSTGRT
ncbi:MAG TPA: ABC transporter ATP-binding protein [Streptosporangiaceae bacterium]